MKWVFINDLKTGCYYLVSINLTNQTLKCSIWTDHFELLPSFQVPSEPALVLQVKVESMVPAAARVLANPDGLVTVILNEALST